MKNSKAEKTWNKNSYFMQYGLSLENYLLLCQYDPTTVEEDGDIKPGSYVDWLVKVKFNMDLWSEKDAIRGFLKIYHDNKYGHKDFLHTNIYRYLSFGEFIEEINAFIDVNMKAKINSESAKAGTEVLIADKEWNLLRITTPEAAVYYGRQSGVWNGDEETFTGRWCIAFSDPVVASNHFDRYTSGGIYPVYYILNRNSKDKKTIFAIVPSSGEFRDGMDESVSISEIMASSDFAKRSIEVIMEDFVEYIDRKRNISKETIYGTNLDRSDWQAEFIFSYGAYVESFSGIKLFAERMLINEQQASHLDFGTYNNLSKKQLYPIVSVRKKGRLHLGYVFSIATGEVYEDITGSSLSLEHLEKVVPTEILQDIYREFLDRMMKEGKMNINEFIYEFISGGGYSSDILKSICEQMKGKINPTWVFNNSYYDTGIIGEVIRFGKSGNDLRMMLDLGYSPRVPCKIRMPLSSVIRTEDASPMDAAILGRVVAQEEKICALYEKGIIWTSYGAGMDKERHLEQYRSALQEKCRKTKDDKMADMYRDIFLKIWGEPLDQKKDEEVSKTPPASMIHNTEYAQPNPGAVENVPVFDNRLYDPPTITFFQWLQNQNGNR